MRIENSAPASLTSAVRFFIRKKAVRFCALPLVTEPRPTDQTMPPQVLFEGDVPSLLYGTEDALATRAILSLFSIYPSELRREIEARVVSRRRMLCDIEEIRLSSKAASSICFCGVEYSLSVSVSCEMLSSMVKAICHGAPFSHREEMAEGYLPFENGVRVGVAGACRYNGSGEGSAIHSFHTLIFRIPHTPLRTEALAPLCEHIRKHSHRGCLIVSPPRVGKTTMLRMLCRAFSFGEQGVRVAVVDTRGEFTDDDFAGAKMDALTGYGRERGAGIALRTLSPKILAMDEIGAEGDVRALCDVMRAGVYLLASAHARDLEDIKGRPLLSQIVEAGVFDCALLLSRESGHLSFQLCRL
ncbi:MAG: hypothetical protein IKC72_06550 [Clostridia bacterium]|nr:hypothetical protein [Clostridia bacterium]